jgi:hypothetical protein
VAAADELDSCVKLSDDLAVAGCSRAIASHQYTGRSLARLYAGAIKDFVQAIRLDPKDTQAYYDRGMVGKRSAVYERYWPMSKCILNSLLPTRMALRL